MKKHIIVKNLNDHGFEIGQIVTVVPSYAGGYQATAAKGETPNNNWVSSQEIELAPVSDNRKILVVTILFLIACALLDCATARADGYMPYVEVGVGYKFSETRYFDDYRDGSKFYIEFNDPLAARIEVYWEHGNWRFGAGHYSNWLTGWPFNKQGEIQNTQLFMGYRWGGQ